MSKVGQVVSIPDVSLDDPFFTSHLITYIGNKRRLRHFLHGCFCEIAKEFDDNKMIILDGFAGSGAVARLLKTFAKELYVNDIEDYSYTINKAYLANKSEIVESELASWIEWLNKNKLSLSTKVGFIESNYAPRDDENIKAGERVFYTNKNAKIIDNLRRLIEEKVPEEYRIYCLASLLVQSSIHTNTSGVFKGFHKKNGIGHFGGHGENALTRILGEISLDMPIFSRYECPVIIFKEDINKLVNSSKVPGFDLVYYDPPYNQHPYGSNYFMLNLINGGRPMPIQDGVSGIIKNWYKSDYNKRDEAITAMRNLIRDTNSKYIAISYNNEGLIPIEIFKEILDENGTWKLFEMDYNTYRGSRNLKNRDLKVKELLWVLKKTKRNN